ncbi:MAG TPA: FAD binding domain-containing protein, partial [Kineobactrum sp.]
GLKGTKEGCASGDCGACTVLVGDGVGPPQSVNACIALLGSLEGKQLLTVDGLAGRSGEDVLVPGCHPVQLAMVEHQGSQCGFCTPGFVMSLAGLYAALPGAERGDNDGAARTAVCDAISGNLCRCTGYRSIIEAGQRMTDYRPAPVMPVCGAGAWPANQNRASQPLPGYHLPESETALQQLLAQYPDARLVAGGTDMVLEISQQYAQPERLIDLCSVRELQCVDCDDDYLTIGAAVPYTRLENVLAGLSAPMYELLHRLGSRQIRNRGTLGGNLATASPIADTPPALLVWDAQLEIASASGARRWLPVEAFYRGYRQTVLAPGDYIAAVRIARASIARPHRLYKLSKRFEDDISSVMGAFSIQLEQGRVSAVRIAYGGMAATPLRAPATEQLLLGATLTDDLVDAAAAHVAAGFQPLDDVRASARYRSAMAANLLRRALLELRDGVCLDVFAAEAFANA